MRNVIVTTLLFAICAPALAQSFESKLYEGFDLLSAGEPAAAMEAFLDLQVEAPDSEAVQFGIASARYHEALSTLDESDPAPAVEQLNAARAEFEALAGRVDSDLVSSARLGAANSAAQAARHSAAAEEYKETLKAYEDSVQAYENVLMDDPGNAQARANLNHVRYALKSLLQNPPPEQQQQQQDEGDGDEGDQGNEGEDGDDGDQNQDGEDQSNQSDQGDESEDDGEQQERDGEVGQGTETKADMEQNPLSRQNIEAILDSLEEKNREEQKNLRRATTSPQVQGGQWW